MKRMFVAGLLALPVLAVVGTEVRAQGCSQFGMGGFCFKFLGGIHQHGPLYNYGPYSGYYPFEPYGPWNSQLQYTGPMPGANAACGWGRCGACGGWARGGAACGTCGHAGHLHGLTGRERDAGCDSCGTATAGRHGLFGGLFDHHQHTGLFHWGRSTAADGCGNCSSSTDGLLSRLFHRLNPFDRAAGCTPACGSTPACGGCATGCTGGKPVAAQLESQAVQSTGFSRTER